MVELTYLLPGVDMPDLGEEEPWLLVEASDDGRFFGTGCGRMPSGDAVFYASLPDSDVTLEAALTAAVDWAAERGVGRIWVQTTP